MKYERQTGKLITNNNNCITDNTFTNHYNSDSKIRLNLQFFAEGGDEGDAGDRSDLSDSITDNSGNTGEQIDSSAFADLIAERDKKIEELEKSITELKKSNANLLVRVNAGTAQQEKSFEENLFDLVGQPTRKER